MKTATLQRGRSGDYAQWTAATFLPDYGMNSLQLHGWLPGMGDVTLLAPPPEPALELMLKREQDPFGWRTFQFGGAWLVPFANRIWGERDGGDITVRWNGSKLRLPEYLPEEGTPAGHALHGLLLATPFTDLVTSGDEDEATLTAEARVGDFGGRWRSSLRICFRARISASWMELEMRAENVGDSTLPVAIGWHPYFLMPGGRRAQLRLRLPARQRLEVNSYDCMRPSGVRSAVRNTAWDFCTGDGQVLGNKSYDDCFVDLDETSRDVHLHDDASGCELVLRLHSAEIQAIQLFSSRADQSLAIEPQYNLPDPFNPVWQGNSGMVELAPGQSTAYRVALGLRHHRDAANSLRAESYA